MAAVHARPETRDTDWNIIACMTYCCKRKPYPVIATEKRAVAVAMRDGRGRALALLAVMQRCPSVQNTFVFAAARAMLLRR